MPRIPPSNTLPITISSPKTALVLLGSLLLFSTPAEWLAQSVPRLSNKWLPQLYPPSLLALVFNEYEEHWNPKLPELYCRHGRLFALTRAPRHVDVIRGFCSPLPLCVPISNFARK